MDGENNGKPYEQMDDLGGFPIFLVTPKYLEVLDTHAPKLAPFYALVLVSKLSELHFLRSNGG